MKKKARKSSSLKKFIVGVTLATAATGSALWVVKEGKPLFPVPSYKVIEVIDGDTFITENKQHVRLLYADAPEKGNCGYEEARNELTKLIKDNQVAIRVRFHDPYRLYSEVYSDKGDVNLIMIQKGWARYNRRSTQATDYIAAAEDAKRDKRGIFGLCVSEIPDKPGCEIKGNINSSLRKTYTFPGCGTYAITSVDKDLGDQWFCTESEAKKAGFTKAANCPK